MKRYGKFITEQTTDVSEIITTSSDEVYTDKVLRSMNFYPIAPFEGQHSEFRNCIIKYTLVNDDEGGHIEQHIVVIPTVKTYSKLKILMGAQTCGFLEQFIQLLNSNAQLKLIWDASNVVEENELLSQYLPEIGQALGKAEEELRNFLNTYCVVD